LLPADPRRGEIWRVDLDPTRGDEMRKTRPAVVVSDNSLGRLRLRIIAPITDWKDAYAHYPWMIRLDPDQRNGLSKPSAADAFQVRSLSVDRLREPLGELSDEHVDAIAEAIALCVAYPPR